MNTPLAIRSGARVTIRRMPWLAPRTPLSPGAQVRALAESIFHEGALLQRANCAPVLVGDFQWEEPHLIRWFPAFGDRETDVGEFCFHYAHADSSRAEFRHAGGNLVEMITIDEAEVDDRDDYRVAWQIWQYVAPLQAKRIEAAYRGSRTEAEAAARSPERSPARILRKSCPRPP